MALVADPNASSDPVESPATGAGLSASDGVAPATRLSPWPRPEWNATARAYPRDRTIPQLFAEVVAKAPEAVALGAPGEPWSIRYRELDDRANRLAGALLARGTRAGDPVGILLDRSPELITALLAVLKAGGICVPLDPEYPAPRLAFMLADTGAACIVSRLSLQGHAALEHHEPVFVDGVATAAVAGPGGMPPLREGLPRATAEDVAYILYTSGSTGQPKGVAIPHRAIVRLVRQQTCVEITPQDVVGQVASVSFDAALFEVWGALLNGAQLALVPTATVLRPERFAAVLAQERVTCLLLTTALFNHLVSLQPGMFNSVPQLLFGGERCDPAPVRALLAAGYAGRLVNCYGPTESTTLATWHRVEAADVQAARIPIGRPLANTRVYVLDDAGDPVPVGEVGEICIGGDGIAIGYWGQPERSAESFVPDPFGAPGDRMYRTGDLGAWTIAGTLEFDGRNDAQFKLRGYRIEPGEVEAALAQHPQVQQALVLRRQVSPDDARLVAYIRPRSDVPDAGTLRRWLDARLPSWMCPAAFVAVASFPLTPNGKLDQSALPEPDWEASDPGVPQVAARTDVEEALAGIWSTVLRQDSIGIHDSFFDRGGHSLLAAQVASRVEQTFGVEVPLGMLFEAPSIAALADRITSPAAQPSPRPPLVADHDARGPIPLSPAQRQMWFLDRLEGQDRAYRIVEAHALEGELDVAALASAVDALVARHESLRTCFAAIDGEPHQVIHSDVRAPLVVTDLGGVDAQQRQATVAQAIRDWVGLPFDLARGPLLRLQLLRLDAREHVLVTVVHHIVCDGWSMGVFNRELAALYAGFRHGVPVHLPPLPVRYADYARWQQTLADDDSQGRLLAYWRAKLEGAPPTLPLPTDRAAPARAATPGGRCSLALPAQLVAALDALGRRESATLFMVLLAAFKVLLSRHCGEEDIVVGVPFAGRTHVALEGMVGLFLGTVVLRTHLDGNPAFREALARVRRTVLDAEAHQDLPFGKLIEVLNPDRGGRHSPVFQVLFNMLSFAAEAPAFTGLGIKEIVPPEPPPKYPLTLYVRRRSEGADVWAVFDTGRFEHATVERMLARYRTLLGAIVAAPDMAIGRLPLLTPADRLPRSVEDNAVRCAGTGDESWETDGETIAARFRAIAQRHPARVAVRSARHAWTYAQLLGIAGGIADRIAATRAEGSGRVALLLEHDAPMVAAILGTLLAGEAYVPLAATDPAARLAAILADADARLLVTDSRHRSLAASLAGTRLATLLVEDLHPAAYLPTPNVAVDRDSIAYLLYTSGSTGSPKAVVQTQGNVLGHIRAYAHSLRLAPGDRLTLLASYGFDAAVMDIFGALLTGATLCPFDIRTRDPGDLSRWLHDEAISVLHATPTVFRYVARESADLRPLPALRLVVLGGEAVRADDLALHRRRFGSDAILVNGYGPTEFTVGLQYFAGPRTVCPGDAVPLGYPLPGVEVTLCNRYGDEAQPFGEITLRSDRLALGYWREPALTGVAFGTVADRAGLRSYRTGDLARLLPDGMLEFVGRRDAQVKIRGQRVEPGEIEAALLAAPGVAQVAVAVRDDIPGGPRLVAYIVLVDGAPCTPDAWRAFLRARLPETMIPAVYVTLPELPLTTGGKVNRRALPPPPAQALAVRAGHATPGDGIEAMLCAVWADVLGVDEVGLDDNFFDLGGHSLLAAKLFARLQLALGRSLSIATLFQAPTVRALAAMVRGAAGPRHDEVVVTITATGSRPPIFAVPGLGGNVVGYAELARELGPGQPFYALQSIGLDGHAEPLDDISAMARAYVDALRERRPHGPYILAGACFGGIVALEMARLLLAAGEAVPYLALLDPASLPAGPRSLAREARVAALRRTSALGHFTVARLGLYRDEMRSMTLREKARYLRGKAGIVTDALRHRDPFRGDRSDYHQFRVQRANRLALQRYRHRPLDAGTTVVEVYATARAFDVLGPKERGLWVHPGGNCVTYHRMPGRDSGDMLSGECVKTLAAALARQLARALEE